MKRRIKFIVSLSALCLSIAFMAFGVYAATSHSVGVTTSVYYDVGTNISIKVEPSKYVFKEGLTTPNDIITDGDNQNATLTTGTVWTKAANEASAVTDKWEPGLTTLNFPQVSYALVFKITNTATTGSNVLIDVKVKYSATPGDGLLTTNTFFAGVGSTAQAACANADSGSKIALSTADATVGTGIAANNGFTFVALKYYVNAPSVAISDKACNFTFTFAGRTA